MTISRKIISGKGYCAVVEDGFLVEYIPFDTEDRSGEILLGKAERIMAGTQSAFVDIGRRKSGFLPLEEQSRSYQGTRVRSGETMILQVRKEETGEKGAFLTRDVTLPGRNVILMPMNRYIGVSSRIRDGEERQRLSGIGSQIAGNRFGLVLRNAASGAEEDALRQEAERLYTLWKEIRAKADCGGKPGTVLWSDDPAVRAEEDYAAGGFERIRECGEPGPEIRSQLKEASERTLRLPGGGNIVIDLCEAMTVIDVNTASNTGTGSKEKTVTDTNLEACETIARQVRLRNLSGIILIDFIDMEDETDRSLVLERLSECFSRDRIKTVIHGWTNLGIMEMTRKRSGRRLTARNETTDQAIR